MTMQLIRLGARPLIHPARNLLTTSLDGRSQGAHAHLLVKHEASAIPLNAGSIGENDGKGVAFRRHFVCGHMQAKAIGKAKHWQVFYRSYSNNPNGFSNIV